MLELDTPYSYNGILYRNKKVETADTSNNTDESQIQYSKQNKPNSKECIVWSIHRKFK